ncbi:MAG: hypothetical protein IJS28_07285 [Synergistaceae bacterium]|nr:hypothetical protein [Synergistaceae bacterium]
MDNETTIERDDKGRFVKGQSGNPSGRPRVPEEVRNAIKAACPEAVQRLIGFMSHENAKIAMMAITEILDRGYGKATQMQDVQIDVNGAAGLREEIRSLLLEREAERGTDS